MEDKDSFEEEELARGLLIHFKSNYRVQTDLLREPEQKQEFKTESDLELKTKIESKVLNIFDSENKVTLIPVEVAKEEKKRKAIEATGKKMQKAGGAMVGRGVCLLYRLLFLLL